MRRIILAALIASLFRGWYGCGAVLQKAKGGERGRPAPFPRCSQDEFH